MSTEDVCWALTTGEAGMRSQVFGLSEAVGLPVVEKRIAVRAPWSWLPGGLLPMPLSALDPAGDMLTPPWPRLLIACGRRSVGPALAVKRASGGRTLAVYVQNPKWARRQFDLVVVMTHDDAAAGDNVMAIDLALHHITAERLEAARSEWRERLAPDDTPVLGVLIGGDNKHYSLTARVTERLIRILRTAHETHGMRVCLTPSRRTGDAAKRRIAGTLSDDAIGTIWDETGPNPYVGILALADRLIVTGESISMVSEALASGRPVHVLPLEGFGRRHERFIKGLVERGLVSRIEADDLDWHFAGTEPIMATAEPTARIRALLKRSAAQA